MADDVAGAPDGMAEAERFLLTVEAGLTGRRLQIAEERKFSVFVAGFQRLLEFELDIEIVLDDALPRPSRRRNARCPASIASSTTYWMTGLSTTVSISFGTRLGRGQKASAEGRRQGKRLCGAS